MSLDGTDITVTVMSPDGSRTRVYRVALEAPPVELALTPAWTAIDWPGAGGVAIAEAGLPDTVVAVYAWDETARTWLTFFPGLEDVPGLNTLTTSPPAPPTGSPSAKRPPGRSRLPREHAPSPSRRERYRCLLAGQAPVRSGTHGTGSPA